MLNLSYIKGLKPDNETYLCGESYWTGIEHDVMDCNLKNKHISSKGTEMKGIAFVTDNNSLRMKVNEQNDFPDSFGCSIYSPETTGNYIYPVCKNTSLSTYSSRSSTKWGSASWGQDNWDSVNSIQGSSTWGSSTFGSNNW